jgi:hypothetical protein
LDAWTPPLEYLPRWYAANAYPEISDYVATPSVTGFTTTLTYYTPSGAALPASWVLSTPTDSATGSVLQKIFEVFTHQKSLLNTALISVYLNRTAYYDTADLDYAWFVETTEKAEKLDILLSSGSRLNITQASDIQDLFSAGDYRWIQDGKAILISGLDLQEQSSQLRVDDWHFVTGASKWTSGAITYLQHPTTKNNIPLHPSQTRSDGFLGFNGTTPVVLRNRLLAATQALSAVTVYVNDQPYTAQRIDLWTSVDEKGLWFNLRRKDTERNVAFSETLENLSWFGGQSYTESKNAISAKLRTGLRATVSASSSSFTVPSDSTGYSIRNKPLNYGYRRELLKPNSTLSTYRSAAASGEYGNLFLNGRSLSYSATGNIIAPSVYSDNNVDQAIMNWKLTYWTQTGSTITFSVNCTDTDDRIVFYPKKVDVIEPDDIILRKSFKSTCPGLKWQHYVIETFTLDVANIKGLATFE